MELHERFNTQNIVKGLLMVSVVFFHSSLFVLEDYRESLTNFNLLVILFPFLMVVFFFYAGYNYVPGKRSIGQNILRRTKQLIIPFIIGAAISIGLEFLICYFTGDSVKAITNGILYFLMSEGTAVIIGFPSDGVLCFDMTLATGIYWFIYALYICSIFFFLIVDYAMKKPSRMISIIFALVAASFALGQFVGPYLPYTVQSYPVILAIMLTAAYLKKYNFLNRPFDGKRKIVFIIINMIVAELIVAGIGLFGYFQYGANMIGGLPGGQFNGTLKGFDAPISFIMGILGTYALHTFSRFINLVPGVSFSLDWLGRHSYICYFLHPIVISFIHRIIFQQNKTLLGAGQPFLYVFMTIAILVAILLLIDLIKKLVKKNKKVEEPVDGTEANW